MYVLNTHCNVYLAKGTLYLIHRVIQSQSHPIHPIPHSTTVPHPSEMAFCVCKTLDCTTIALQIGHLSTMQSPVVYSTFDNACAIHPCIEYNAVQCGQCTEHTIMQCTSHSLTLYPLHCKVYTHRDASWETSHPPLLCKMTLLGSLQGQCTMLHILMKNSSTYIGIVNALMMLVYLKSLYHCGK